MHSPLTGKSYTLEHVVTSAVAEELCKLGGGHPLEGMVVLRLDAGQLNRQAKRRHGPAVEPPGRPGRVESKLRSLAAMGYRYEVRALGIASALEAHVPVQADEAQNLLLPTIGGKLDSGGAAYIRASFMKTLLAYGSHTTLWCLTGSSMASTWVSLADMPPNGYQVFLCIITAVLPATYSPGHMRWAWERLQVRSPGVALDPRLMQLCPPSVALLTLLVAGWLDAGRPGDVAAFVRGFMRTKLMEEVSPTVWVLVWVAVAVVVAVAVADRGLSSPDVGFRIDMGLLDTGLRRFLEPHLDRAMDGAGDGRWYLRDAHQRQIMRLMIDQDGTLRDSCWSDQELSATLTQGDGAWSLLPLGEAADFLLGPNSSPHERSSGGGGLRSSSRSGGHGGEACSTDDKGVGDSGSGGGRGGGATAAAAAVAVAKACARDRPGPAAGSGQRTPLGHAPGRHGVWGQGGPQAAALAPRRPAQRSVLAPAPPVGGRATLLRAAADTDMSRVRAPPTVGRAFVVASCMRALALTGYL
ncbi:hypothetical protein HYH03_013872 [Edaphochlamys debaryana]|uniref:Uncharacterized protein n=1 Tax=Edaphochlamys debaryana TaxID=47281 RepID=A0A835XP19_9CHLO|nr:hypothetical protein HYH03_013872 [Edaphochlamys debaryana]|eukprot:KAG2487593.1 hypothetical protein HYH03_013872 [Edaphochlamys debaryana]